MNLSVVVPCYNEEENLNDFYVEMKKAIIQSGVKSYEIILVDDGSKDQSWPIIQNLCAFDSFVKGVKLSRNFGHQAALTAGLIEARGEYVFIIDADLQDPPGLLKDMLTKAKEGHDVVYGKRRIMMGERRFKLWTANQFYRTLSTLSDIKIPRNTGDFRLINRKVLIAYQSLSESHRYSRGLIAWGGFRQTELLYDRMPRLKGVSKYPLRKMNNFSLDAMTGYSLKAFRMIMWLGLITSGVSFMAVLYALFSWPYLETVSGWTSLMSVVMLISSVQLVCLGVVGEYVGRTCIETKKRPLYFIETRSSDAQKKKEELDQFLNLNISELRPQLPLS